MASLKMANFMVSLDVFTVTTPAPTDTPPTELTKQNNTIKESFMEKDSYTNKINHSLKHNNG